MPELITRHLALTLEGLLVEDSVLLLSGPRAAGKTTLISRLATAHSRSVIDLSIKPIRDVALLDADAILAHLPEPVVIDEYQFAPELLSVIKRSVDRDPRFGAYVLTGSTTGALLPRGTESLAGRVHELVLWGLSQGEIEGRRDRFIDTVFESPETLRSQRGEQLDHFEYAKRITRGSFPSVVVRESESAQQRWLIAYASRIIDRDLADLVTIRQPGVFRQVVAACAARTAQVTNLAGMANDLAVGREAVRNYIEILERIFLVTRLPAFSRNRNSRTA